MNKKVITPMTKSVTCFDFIFLWVLFVYSSSAKISSTLSQNFRKQLLQAAQYPQQINSYSMFSIKKYICIYVLRIELNMFKLNDKYTASTSVDTLLVSSKEDTKCDMKYISLVLLFLKFSRFLRGGLVFKWNWNPK